MSHDVFICHSSVDRVIANAVCARLEQNRIRCWIAPRDVIPGREFAESIIEAIHGSKLTILVFSANSNSSQHVHKEIERSVNAGIPILPFRVEDVMPSPALEYFISDAHWLDALSPPLEDHLDHLVGTVQLLLNRETPGDESTLAPVAAAPVAPERITPETPSRRGRIALWVGLAAALLAVVVVGALLLTRGGGSPAESVGPGGPSTTTSSSQPVSTPFTDEFTGTVDPSWTWLNEKPGAWKVTAKGKLEITGQQPPPYRNVLLRAAPTGSYSVKLTLTFPTTGKGFTGLVLTGSDPSTRLQFGWTDTALVTMTYKDGNIDTDNEMMTPDLPVKPGGEAQLLIEVKNAVYTTKIYDPTYDTWFDMGTGHLDPAFTKLGLLVYAKPGASVTGSFDRIEVFF